MREPSGYTQCRSNGRVPWCSGLTCVPVKDEIASSNLVGTARKPMFEGPGKSKFPRALFYGCGCGVLLDCDGLPIAADG